MSFTLQTPMLFASSTLSNMEHLNINLLHHKKQTDNYLREYPKNEIKYKKILKIEKYKKKYASAI